MSSRTDTPASSHRAHCAVSGFTLVEMLVTLVIVSIGMLGIAKLTLGTVQANDSALMRSEATVLLQQVIENMRANDALAQQGQYDIALGATPAVTSIPTQDLNTWKTMLQSALPSGDGSIVTAAGINPQTGGNEYVATVTVQWDDSVAEQAFGAAAGVQTLSVETML
jgi:type IV pilus assembly protein PilV